MSLYSRTVAGGSVTPTTVSTLTVLMPFTELAAELETLLFYVLNQSATETVTATLETSEDGVLADSDRTYTLTAPPSTQASQEVQLPLRTYWRLSASTASPTFNTASVRWGVKAGRR